MTKGLIGKIIDHLNNMHPGEFDRALIDFTGLATSEEAIESLSRNNLGQGLFMEWLVFDYKIAGNLTPIQDYYLNFPQQLDIKVINEIKNLTQNEFGIFEVIDLKRNVWVKVCNLQTGQIRLIHEKTASRQLEKNAIIFLRIAKIGNHFEMVSSNAIGIGINILSGARKFLRQTKDRIDPKMIYKMLGVQNINETELLKEYIEWHNKIPKTKITIESALKILDKSQILNDASKSAILFLAHSGERRAIIGLEKAKRTIKDPRLLFWVNQALGECLMFQDEIRHKEEDENCA